MSIKPLVHFDASKHHHIVIGGMAVVYPINHPSPYVSNTKAVVTSPVLSYDKDTNTFETQNTIYKGARVA